MNITGKIGIAVATGALAVGGTAAAFGIGVGGASAGSDPTGTGNGAKAAFVCAHLTEIQSQQTLKGQLLTGRVTLLQEARDAATKPKAQARLDKAIAKTKAAETKLSDREAKLTTFAAAHCTSGGGVATTAPTTPTTTA